MKKNASLFILLIIYSAVFSQEKFIPVKDNVAKQDYYYQKSEEALDHKLDTYSGDYKKEYKKFIKRNKEYLKDIHSLIYYEPDYTDYLNRILEQIVESNPELKKVGLRINYIHDASCNVFNTGEGSIFVHLGAYNYLEKESELAMILCHEIGHQVLGHVDKSFEKKQNIIDNEVDKLSKLRATNLDAYKLLIKFSRSTLFRSFHSDRVYELEADSMALLYFQNTPYSLDKGIKSFERLKASSEIEYDMDKMLKFLFDFPNYPFQDKWLHHEESMVERLKKANWTEEVKDSLSTHPNIDLRIAKTKEFALHHTSKSDKEIAPATFTNFRDIARKQVIYSMIKEDNVSEALWYSMNYLYATKDPYYFQPIYTCLNKIATGLDQHKLHNMVARRNPSFSDDYNKLLTFIDNLNLDDVLEIKKEFKTKHEL